MELKHALGEVELKERIGNRDLYLAERE